MQLKAEYLKIINNLRMKITNFFLFKKKKQKTYHDYNFSIWIKVATNDDLA